MSREPLRLQRLRPDHELTSFRCGITELDNWLHRHALPADQMDSARTFVLTSGPQVIGYVSLTMGSVQRADPPASLVRGTPGYPVGMVLIARLAVDQQEQGTGLGTRLLADALRMAVAAGDTVAARLIVVDASNDDVAAFYRRHGFTATLDHPLRLYRRMKDVRISLQHAAQPRRLRGLSRRRQVPVRR